MNSAHTFIPGVTPKHLSDVFQEHNRYFFLHHPYDLVGPASGDGFLVASIMPDDARRLEQIYGKDTQHIESTNPALRLSIAGLVQITVPSRTHDLINLNKSEGVVNRWPEARRFYKVDS